jgi:hypothetical protein
MKKLIKIADIWSGPISYVGVSLDSVTGKATKQA